MSNFTVLSTDEHHHAIVTASTFDIPAEVTGTRRIGIAVIGCGRMGAIHLDNTIRNPRANLLYVFDSSVERLEHFRKKYYLDERQVQICSDEAGLKRILEDKRVESLFVATPTFTHEKYVAAGLEHGKHILCEKPLAIKMEQVQELYQLAAKKNVTLMVALQRRYDPSLRQLVDQVKQGVCGDVQVISTVSRDSPTPSMEYIAISGGIYSDCYVHDLDVVLWVAKELPIEAYALGHTHLDSYKQYNDFDVTLITLKFQSGLMANTELARVCSSGYDQRVEVFGPKGALRVDTKPRVFWERINETGKTSMKDSYSFSKRYDEAYVGQVNDFFNHIEGLKVMEHPNGVYTSCLSKIIHAVHESAHTGKVVKINWTKDEIEKAFRK